MLVFFVFKSMAITCLCIGNDFGGIHY